jgi:AcrR family transcriptional regulator
LEEGMPYTAEHKARTRQKIVISARRLFNRHGFRDVSIEQIMANAGLTRGGFYAHFPSKSALYAEAIRAISIDRPMNDWDESDPGEARGSPARMLVTGYLSENHLNEVERSCPLLALPGDVARSDDEVKAAYAEVFKALVGVFQANLPDADAEARERALAIGALCVGGMVLARAVGDKSLGDAVRDACRKLALETGGWTVVEPERKAA